MLRDFYRNRALKQLRILEMREAEAYANELFTSFIRGGAKPLVLLGLLSFGSPSVIIKTIGLPRSVVYHHVRNLVKRGIVEKERVGNVVVYKPSRLCLSAIVLFNEKLLDAVSRATRVDENVDDLISLFMENPTRYFERLLYYRSLISKVAFDMNEGGLTKDKSQRGDLSY